MSLKNDNNNSNSYIEISHIYKSYKGECVLHIPYLKIPLGVTLAILGESGAGKSTLINILGLIDYPDGSYIDDEGKNTTPSNHLSYQ